MKEVSRLISVKNIYCTRYNPKNNGLVEKYNGLIKKILRRMCHEQPKQWDRYLPALLFALREMPTSSLGFSPFELLYGRTVRGPMSLVREIWTNDKVDTEIKNEYQYVLDLKDRLYQTWELAHKMLGQMAQKCNQYYDVPKGTCEVNLAKDEALRSHGTPVHRKAILRGNSMVLNLVLYCIDDYIVLY